MKPAETPNPTSPWTPQSHAQVLKAINEQNQLLQHNTTIYLNNQIAEYAKELADRMPGNLKVVYFVNSGSEANDMAMMLARAYTGALAVARRSWNGCTR
jgi:4-aminobutyrate aminotransferase-like enzyme